MLCRILSFIVVVAAASSLSAQNTTQTADLILIFRDSRTGTSVVPESVTVDGREVSGRVDPTGKVVVKVPPGDHEVVIKAQNYNQMTTRQSALIEENQTNEILLDPVTDPVDLRPENIEKYLDPAAGLIIGYVVDNETGIALENTQVRLGNDEGRAVTNERGFFALRVPMTSAGPMPESNSGQLFTKKNFEIIKSGFKTEDRRNVVVITGEPKFVGVKLMRGSGSELMDEDEHRNDLQRSIFNPSAPSHEEPTTATVEPQSEDRQTTHVH